MSRSRGRNTPRSTRKKYLTLTADDCKAHGAQSVIRLLFY